MRELHLLRESHIIKANDLNIEDIIKEHIMNFGDNPDLNHIDVSEVTDMSCLFYNGGFNGDVSNWNTENVLNMRFLFSRSKFNGDISLWNTKKVRSMVEIFSKSPFNRDISNWNVEQLILASWMFYKCDFMGDLNKWRPISLLNRWHNNDILDMFEESHLEEDGPIWYKFLKWGFFKSRVDYFESIKKYGWLKDGYVVLGRLWTAIEIYDGNLKNIYKIKDLRFIF